MQRSEMAQTTNTQDINWKTLKRETKNTGKGKGKGKVVPVLH
jgi:hypothetical protein